MVLRFLLACQRGDWVRKVTVVVVAMLVVVRVLVSGGGWEFRRLPVSSIVRGEALFSLSFSRSTKGEMDLHYRGQQRFVVVVDLWIFRCVCGDFQLEDTNATRL